MKVSVTLEFDSATEAQAALAKLGASTKDAPSPAPEKSAPKADKPAASSPTVAGPAPAPVAPVKKYDDTGIAALIKTKAGDAKVKPLVVELLKKFGVEKGPQLKPDQFDAFTAELEALKAPEEELG